MWDRSSQPSVSGRSANLDAMLDCGRSTSLWLGCCLQPSSNRVHGSLGNKFAELRLAVDVAVATLRHLIFGGGSGIASRGYVFVFQADEVVATRDTYHTAMRGIVVAAGHGKRSVAVRL